jgi:hypothetical protein
MLRMVTVRPRRVEMAPEMFGIGNVNEAPAARNPARDQEGVQGFPEGCTPGQPCGAWKAPMLQAETPRRRRAP